MYSPVKNVYCNGPRQECLKEDMGIPGRPITIGVTEGTVCLCGYEHCNQIQKRRLSISVDRNWPNFQMYNLWNQFLMS